MKTIWRRSYNCSFSSICLAFFKCGWFFSLSKNRRSISPSIALKWGRKNIGSANLDVKRHFSVRPFSLKYLKYFIALNKRCLLNTVSMMQEMKRVWFAVRAGKANKLLTNLLFSERPICLCGNYKCEILLSERVDFFSSKFGQSALALKPKQKWKVWRREISLTDWANAIFFSDVSSIATLKVEMKFSIFHRVLCSTVYIHCC